MSTPRGGLLPWVRRSPAGTPGFLPPSPPAPGRRSVGVARHLRYPLRASAQRPARVPRMSGIVQWHTVLPADFESFYQHLMGAEATWMASFPSREREDFMAHWPGSRRIRKTRSGRSSWMESGRQSRLLPGRGTTAGWPSAGEGGLGAGDRHPGALPVPAHRRLRAAVSPRRD